MNLLKQGQAQAIHLGPFVDDTDGATPETGLTIAASDIYLSKNGGNFAVSSATSIGHDVNGEYNVTLSAADTNTLGILRISVKVAGALSVPESYFVVTADVYNALTANTGNLKVDLNTIETHGLQSGLWELAGKRLHLTNNDASGVAFKAESTGTNSIGLQAIGTQNDIDASELNDIKADTAAIVAKLPVTGLIASQDSVDNIENNTRLSISLPTKVLIPNTGVTAFRIKCFLKDEGGNPEDPDNNELSVQIRADNGAVYKTALYNDEGLTTPATASSTFTPSYFKMNRLGVGAYELFYGLNGETTDTWAFVFTFEENGILNNLGRGLLVSASIEGGAVLADVVTNHQVIAKSMKNNSQAAEPDLVGSIYRDLITPQNQVVSKLPSGIISDLSLATVIDGSQTLGDTMKYMKAMFNGRVKKDFPNPGDFTMYAHDNVTVLSVVNSTTIERTRVS